MLHNQVYSMRKTRTGNLFRSSVKVRLGAGLEPGTIWLPSARSNQLGQASSRKSALFLQPFVVEVAALATLNIPLLSSLTDRQGPPVRVLKGFLGGTRGAPPLANVRIGVTIWTTAQQKWPGLEPVDWQKHQSYEGLFYKNPIVVKGLLLRKN
uniref:Uncharacterized protein n=1 Tax=Romanomermis culicivorax TaxID=13658 RepID=A0A915KS97_ROMCU